MTGRYDIADGPLPCSTVRCEFEGEVWLYEGPDPWHFITVPMELSETIRDNAPSSRSRFGSIRVVATIGGTTWSTSVFPDKESGALLLPVKAAVRETEDLAAGAVVTVHIDVAG